MNCRIFFLSNILALFFLIASIGCQSTLIASSDAIELPMRIRGITLKLENTTPEIIQRAVDYGVNFVVVNFKVDRDRKKDAAAFAPTAEDPFIPYPKNLAALRAILPTCKQNNLKIAVSVVPWGRNQDFCWNAEKNQDFREHLVQFWQAFATEFKGEPSIVAYTIMSEPNYPDGNADVWYEDILPENMKAIRAINSNIWLIVQPGPWGMPGGFNNMKPIDDPYILYCYHGYAPHGYLHQGIFKKKNKDNPAYAPNQTYPGKLQMFGGSPRIHWDKKQLKTYMKPAYDFAKKHKVRMFNGEFSAVRWAPGREKWTSDVLEIMEEWGFDWCSFSLAGWNGWNPTFGPDEKPSLEPYGGVETPTLKIWQKYWGLNKNDK